MAARERKMDAHVAATWFREGERQFRAGEVAKAIGSFRKASSNARDNRQYALALADVLAAAGHSEESRQALVRLRESAPESAEINLRLARLVGSAGDVPGAVRYYHNALYGLWTGSQVDEQRRNVRLELVHFLLGHQQQSRALSELLILESEMGDDAAAHRELAQLFLQAGDAQNALKHFSAAVRMNRRDGAALAGAGETAFQLGDYVLARRYLEAAVAQNPDSKSAAQLLSVTRMIFANDPLAPRLTWAERSQRLERNFAQALARLQTCLAESQGEAASNSSELQALEPEATAMRGQLRPANLRNNPELLRAGMELIYRIEQASNTHCGEATGLDRALLLIARKYEAALQ